MKNDKEKRLIRLLKMVLISDRGAIRLETFAKNEGYCTRIIKRDIVSLQGAGLLLFKNYNNTWPFIEGFNS